MDTKDMTMDKEQTREQEVSDQRKAKKKLSKPKRIILFVAVILLMLIVACDTRLKTVRYTFSSPKVENSFKIALITDLHGNTFTVA